jgi:hypothetical protein
MGIVLTAVVAVAAVALAGCSALASIADPASDAPESRSADAGPFAQAASYADTLRLWQGPDEVNAWIGARFEYDVARAMQLSETQRQANGRMPILAPEVFFAAPKGVCVDLARFAVETLRAIAPEARATYLMVEFDPVSVSGNTLRRHWVASFERDGKRYFFADSKRPGHIAGPYGSTQEFVTEYAVYRGRRIVSFREAESFERKVRTQAAKQSRDPRH